MVLTCCRRRRMADEQDLPLTDKDIVQMPADFRQDLANRLLSNTYSFCKFVMGYKDLTKRMHGPICRFLDINPAQIRFIAQPRETFKSSISTISWNAKEIAKDVNKTRVIIGKKIDNSSGFVKVIKATAESNKIYRALYSHVIPKDFRKVTWNETELEFNRTDFRPEPTVRAAGLFSALASQHYDHLGYDDIVAEEESESPDLMKKAGDRAMLFRPLMRNPAVATMIVTFTHWGFHDAYHVMMERIGTRAAKLIRGAIENGELTFPERLNEEMLAHLQQEFGAYMFSCLYMNNPRDESVQDFNVKDLKVSQVDYENRCVHLYQDGVILRTWRFSQLDITATVDLQGDPVKKGKHKLPDRNAISVVGVSPEQEVISLEAWGARCTPLDLMRQVFLFHIIYSPRVWGIEDVAYQAALKYFVGDYAEREDLYLNVVPIKSIQRKETRIRGLQPVASSGRLYVGAGQAILKHEMADFPLGQFDDVLDALSMQLQVMTHQMNSERWKRYLQSEQKVLAEIEVNRRLLRGERVELLDEDELVEEIFPSTWTETELGQVA